MGLWTPADISTLGWWDAADPSTITIATGVSQWRDKSGNSRHAVQGTASLQPAVVTSAVNGLSALSFGASAALLVSNLPTPSTVNTFVVWNKPSSGGVAYQRIFSSGPTTGDDYTVNGVYLVCPTASDGVVAGGPGLDAQKWGGASKALQNFYFGRINKSALFYFSGQLCEVVITPIISDDDYAKMQGSLAWKWGIESTLATDHPYRYAPPYNSARIKLAAELVQTWGDVAVAKGELHQPWGIKTGADLIQPWSNAPQVRGALYQPWGEALAARAELVQPWGNASAARAMLVQPWASSFPQRAELVQPWGDASAARGILEQPWGDASAARAELVQPWASSFSQRAELVQPWASSFPQRAELGQGWNIFGVIVAELEQRWAITGDLVRGELLQGWDLRERDLLRAELVQRWAIEADGTDVAGEGSDGVMRYVVAVRVGGTAVGIDQLNIEGGTDGDTITCEIQIGSEDDYLRCAIGAALEVTITSVDGTDDFVFVITDARIAEEHGKTTYAVEAESPGVLLGDSYADPVDGELSGMASAIAASLAGGV